MNGKRSLGLLLSAVTSQPGSAEQSDSKLRLFAGPEVQACCMTDPRASVEGEGLIFSQED